MQKEKYITIDDYGNQRIPKEYQWEGVEYVINRPASILCYDMGLGKTLISIIAALELNKKTLIICPATLKYNWFKEFSYFFNKGIIKKEDISIIEGKKWVDNKIVIINYDILKNFHKIERTKIKNSTIIKNNFEVLICDEAHYVKNAKSQRSKLVYDISKYMKNIILLTGTPISSKPIELFNLLRIVRHELSYNYIHFGKMYCDGKTTPWGWDFNGSSNESDLHRRIQNVMLRKKKENNLTLKGKQKNPIYFQIKDKRKYKKVIDDYFKDVELKIKEAIENGNTDSPYFYRDINASRQLVELSILRKYFAEEKVDYTIAHAENIIDQYGKVVIFTCFTSCLNKIAEHFGNKAVIINGSIKNEKRVEAVDKFNKDKNINVIICNLVAGGVGINLTSASNIIFNDLDYRPDLHEQAEDRCYRLGQEEFVNCYYMLFENSLETTIYNLLAKKQKINQQIIDGVKVDNINILDELLKEIKSIYQKPLKETVISL